MAFGITSPVSLWTKTVIGTPQARWREITQSGRCSTMPLMRLRPCAGTKRVSPMDVSASSRRLGLPFAVGLSIAMNHCGVFR